MIGKTVIRRDGEWPGVQGEYADLLKGVCDARNSTENAVLLTETAHEASRNIRKNILRAKKMLREADSPRDKAHLKRIIREYSKYVSEIEAIRDKSLRGTSKFMQVLPGIVSGICMMAGIAVLGTSFATFPRSQDSIEAARAFFNGVEQKTEYIAETTTLPGGGVIGDGKILINGEEQKSIRIVAGQRPEALYSLGTSLIWETPDLGGKKQLSQALGELLHDYYTIRSKNDAPEEDVIVSVSNKGLQEYFLMNSLPKMSSRDITKSPFYEVNRMTLLTRKAATKAIAQTLQKNNPYLSKDQCRNYARIIQDKARCFGLDPFLVTGIIVTESHGKTSAVSRIPVYQKNAKGEYVLDAKGNRIPLKKDGKIVTKPCAVGLMQVNFDAHREGILKQMGVTAMDQLKNPSIGIESGCRILAEIMYRNNWNEEKSLAEYLGVPGRLNLSQTYRDKVFAQRDWAKTSFAQMVTEALGISFEDEHALAASSYKETIERDI